MGIKKNQSEATKFFKSRDGKKQYDDEVRKLNEQRIRMNTWSKEMNKRKGGRNNERYE